MQRRSWMAALTLVALAGAVALGGDEPASTKADAGPASVKRTVALTIRFSGLRARGKVEVKPANAGCRFKPVVQPVDQNVPIQLKPIDVEVFSADRDCSLVITLKEPGQPDKVVRRHFRVEPEVAGADGKVKPQVFDCFLSAVPTKDVAAIAAKPAGEPKIKK